MHRKWLTGLTLVGVAGTGGVAYASVSGASEPAGTAGTGVTAPATTGTTPSSSSPDTSGSAPSSTGAPTRRDVTYQVGDAGSVEIDVVGTTMSAREVDPEDGWTVPATSDTGTHIDVQFTNGVRLVGFSADLVGGEVVVSVTNSLVPGAPGTVTTDPVPVSVVEDSSTLPPPVTPATPGPDTTDVQNTGVPGTAPSSSATTAPSGGGGEHDDDDDDHDDDHGEDVSGHDADDDHGGDRSDSDDHDDDHDGDRSGSDEDHDDDGGSRHGGVDVDDDD